jgi:hypothetical protein
MIVIRIRTLDKKTYRQKLTSPYMNSEYGLYRRYDFAKFIFAFAKSKVYCRGTLSTSKIALTLPKMPLYF